MKRQIQKSRSRVLKAELIKPGEFVEVQTDGTINPPRKVEKSRMMLGCVFWVTTRMGCKACKELEHTPLTSAGPHPHPCNIYKLEDAGEMSICRLFLGSHPRHVCCII